MQIDAFPTGASTRSSIRVPAGLARVVGILHADDLAEPGHFGGVTSSVTNTGDAVREMRSNTEVVSAWTLGLSPELALVDPDLAAVARALLPEPADCLASRPQMPPQPAVGTTALVDATSTATENGRARGSRRSLRTALTAGAWLALAGIVASPLLAFLPPTGAPSLVDALPVPRAPSAPEGRVLTGATIHWRPTAGASVYNVILVRGAQRVDLWPTRPSVRVTRSGRKRVRPAPTVRYSWFVYPGFKRSTGTVRYGALIAHGFIAVVPGTLRSDARPAP